MSGSVLTLTLNLLLFCIQSSQQSVCPTSCCECSLGGQELKCNGSKEFSHFCDVPTVLTKLELQNFKNTKLQYDFKKVTEIEYLIIKSSPITILSDLINGQKSLKGLKLINITIKDGWEWGKMFAQFTNLVDFHLKSTDLLSTELVINGNVGTNNNLISFSVIKCGIESIKSDMISKWTHLKMISLAHNCIHKLDRQWLPLQLESLWSLDLSYNSIAIIPDNFFSGMTALRKLRLDNNSFITLKEQWFQHIWEGLHEFWVDGNKIKCTLDLLWVPNITHPTFFDEATCYSAKSKEVIYFHKFRKGDPTPFEDSDSSPTPCPSCPVYSKYYY